MTQTSSKRQFIHVAQRILFSLILLGALTGVFAQETQQQTQEAPPVVPVGTLFPYTGGGAEWGPVLRNTAELVAQQINEAATETFGGPIIELIHEDAATSPTIGVDRARKLVTVDQVPMLIGTWSSGVAIPIAESVTMPSEILHIVPIATSPLITVLPADDSDLLFRTIGSDAQQGVVAAQLAAGEIIDDYGFDTASVIYVNNAYGQGLADQFIESFEKRGGEVLASIPVRAEPQPTYTAELQQALAGDPDVLLPIVYPAQGNVMLPEARDFYDYTSFQFMDALRTIGTLEAVGPELMAGLYGTTPAADQGSTGYQRFASAYEEAYGEPPPLSFMDTTYDAVAVAGLAVASAVAKGLEPTPKNLRDQLRLIAGPPGVAVAADEFGKALQLLAEGKDIDFSGAAGEVNFDEHGQAITSVAVWQFTEDGFETVALRQAAEIPQE